MDAKNFRIGNWVKTDTGREYKIDLSWFECCTSSQQGEDIQCATFPILITEEWLVKFGFEKRNNNFTKGCLGTAYTDMTYPKHMKENPNYWCIVIIDEIDGDIVPVINMNYKMKYVNQLQNLYFALTGEEL